MRRTRLAIASVFTLVGALVLTAPANAKPTAAPGGHDSLEVYVGTVNPQQLEKLRATGADLGHDHGATDRSGNTEIETVLSGRQAQRLAAQGVRLQVKKVRGKAASQALREQAAAGWKAFRSYSEPGGIRDEITATAARYPKLTKVETIGRSVQGKPILALKVTKDAQTLADGARPSVLYAGTQHAREWITPEMNRRLMHHVLDNYGKNQEITRLVNTTELWFLPVLNPDGYDHTFTPGNRLWRKNLRDNDGDGQITSVDGVDLNRNFDYKWGYDNEGSSPDPASETYRGPSPNSEPETKALDRFFKRVGFEFLVNYHSAAQLLLYGVGWQVATPTPDDVIYEAMVGDDANPAVPGYDPDLSAELYTTNGDTDSYATVKYGTLGFTPEMSTCTAAAESDPDDQWRPEDCVSEFIFPDDEKLIAAEVAKNLPFALAVAKSAKQPDEPVSVVGRSTPDFVVDAFDTSYGRNQQVAAITRRSLKNVKMHFVVNGGRPKSVEVKEWRGGERYGGSHDDYYAELRGRVTGTKPGDRVEVWFSGRKPGTGVVGSERFTYRVHDDIGGDVLILAVEDVTGLSPTQEGSSAKYADEMAASLTAAGRTSDVYDFDTAGRKAPHHLGVLSHYDTVLWETGDDVIPRSPGQVAGTAARAAAETELFVRDYLNEGGKLLLSGKYALYAQSANGPYGYQPTPPAECTDPADASCLPLLNDFQQYYLGAYNYVSDGGTSPDGDPYPVSGSAGPFAGFSGTLNAPGSAANQDHTASFLTTSSFLPPDEFPQFASSAPLGWQRPGGAPFDPRTGQWYLHSGQSDEAYKRLSRTVDLTSASSGELRFWTSYDIETDWDFMIVEAHEVGTDDWTTLPDAGGRTTTSTGESCQSGWVAQIHPFLGHYQGADCSPTGSTGQWHAVTGTSNGWQEFSIDLSAYAGKRVEVAISYVSDWATQGLGVFLDDARVIVDGATVAETSFETEDLGGWTVSGPPEGTAPNSTDWSRSQQAFEEGSAVVTADTVYLGFGLEGLPPAARDDLVARSLTHLEGAAR
ncbi:M14 family metallopeptidase [Micromonospora yangpuensis]|uniref:Zinc carboxypeptidase n=1 Tax=Micromonospora yangpuensis TaxID=683228 RepID=A0A1C6UGD3_9ACTN|nr:M14 family metallopeptidase [Micromonospora yangpuensis]GGM04741.1 zinc carboxypeptidase [Micromonospora yangpuensis]SCL53165.1 Immune inhibitor A peptidase M6 [Micromonospora yangpuensis]